MAVTRHTIYRDGVIQGTYAGATEEESLSAYAKDVDKESKDFADFCKRNKTKRDNHKVQEVED